MYVQILFQNHSYCPIVRGRPIQVKLANFGRSMSKPTVNTIASLRTTYVGVVIPQGYMAPELLLELLLLPFRRRYLWVA